MLPKPPDIYAHLRGCHVHEWSRFIILSRTFKQASELAADLGWWLHCWAWGPAESDEPVVIENPPPCPHPTWAAYIDHQGTQLLAALNRPRLDDL